MPLDRFGEPVDTDPEARALAIVDCGLCDDDGYRGTHPCDHVDRSAVHERGIARVRQALAEAAARKAKA